MRTLKEGLTRDVLKQRDNAVVLVVPSKGAAEALFKQMTSLPDNAFAWLTAETYPYDRRAVWRQWAENAFDGLIVTPDVLLHPETPQLLRGAVGSYELQGLFPNPATTPLEWTMSRSESKATLRLGGVLSDETHPLTQAFQSITWASFPLGDGLRCQIHPVFSDALKWRAVQPCLDKEKGLTKTPNSLLILADWPSRVSPLHGQLAPYQGYSVLRMTDVWSEQINRSAVRRLLLLDAMVSVSELSFLVSQFPAVREVGVYLHLADWQTMKRRRQRLGLSGRFDSEILNHPAFELPPLLRGFIPWL